MKRKTRKRVKACVAGATAVVSAATSWTLYQQGIECASPDVKPVGVDTGHRQRKGGRGRGQKRA